ncbi:hypothetical protein NDU88_001550 [Pleurodeles waltl]|uniref:Uncharacterized protein n=1 Tax=Pleurodeles waltl TaxID=8319 RepID=A0AAV7MUZ3_PLEWA|nr:hypothetical protein NDU88_001550 [Pleurodeles waltl]
MDAVAQVLQPPRPRGTEDHAYQADQYNLHVHMFRRRPCLSLRTAFSQSLVSARSIIVCNGTQEVRLPHIRWRASTPVCHPEAPSDAGRQRETRHLAAVTGGVAAAPVGDRSRSPQVDPESGTDSPVRPCPGVRQYHLALELLSSGIKRNSLCRNWAILWIIDGLQEQLKVWTATGKLLCKSSQCRACKLLSTVGPNFCVVGLIPVCSFFTAMLTLPTSKGKRLPDKRYA